MAEKIKNLIKEGKIDMLHKAVTALAIIACAAGAGCESPQQHKQAAQQKWEQTTAGIKLILAQQQYDKGNYDQAAKTVQQCLSADPDNPEAQLLYGKLLLAEGKRSNAIRQFRRSLVLNEKMSESWYLLGVAAQENRNYWQAYEYYRSALSLEPMNVDYILAVADTQVALGNYSQAMDMLDDKMTAMPSNISLTVAAANLMSRMGKNAEAIDLYQQAMFMTSDNETIADALGYCYLFADRWDEAADVFNKLLKQCQDERQRELYLEVLGLCSMNATQYGKAVNCYSKLSVDKRNDVGVWLKMGQATLGAGATDRALKCSLKALSLEPGLPDAVALGGCARYVAGDYDAALKSFDRIAADKELAGFSWLMKARCYEQLSLPDKANQAYKKALEINPHSKLGDFLAKARDVEDNQLPAED